MSDPSLSVIIPTSCRDIAQLRETLGSLVCAECSNRLLEIVIAGNGITGSEEETLRGLVRDLYAPDALKEKITIHRFSDKEESIARSWNRAMKLARGEYVHFLHDDDRVLPTFYERNLGIIDKERPDLLFSGAEKFGDRRGTVLWPGRPMNQNGFLTPEETKNHLVSRKSGIVCPTAIYNVRAWAYLHGWNERYDFACDQAFFNRAMLCGQRIFALQETHYLYRIHGRSATSEITQGCNLLMDILTLQAYGELYRATHDAALLREARETALACYYDEKLKEKQRSSFKLPYRAARSVLKRIGVARRIPALFNRPLRDFLSWYEKALRHADPELLSPDCRTLLLAPFHRHVDAWSDETNPHFVTRALK